MAGVGVDPTGPWCADLALRPFQGSAGGHQLYLLASRFAPALQLVLAAVAPATTRG